MKTELQLHPVQAQILLRLLFTPEARFAELNTTRLSNDHFAFHVKQLAGQGFIEKTTQGRYQLTTKGKEFANRFDTEKVTIERQAKLGVLVVCVDGSGKNRNFLVQQRLKQPYYGFYGFVTGKIRWGETIYETAARELKEETGLTAKVTLVGIKHKLDYAKDGALLEDKYFFVMKATNLRGSLVSKYEGGKNEWLSKSEVLKLPNLFPDVKEAITMINAKTPQFSETKYSVTSY